MFSPRLSIVMPVYNEEGTLDEIIDRVFRSCGDFAEVIFVDDGSTDRSLEILQRKARPQDTVLHKENGGKGSAVRMGYAHAKGHYVIVQDADLEYSPEDIPTVLAHAQLHDLPVLFGSRRLKKQKQFTHLTTFIGGSLLTMMCNLLYGSRLTDQPTCYKMVRNDVLKTLPLQEDDFRFDPELTAMLLLRGYHIAESPISYTPRSFAEGKKICWKDWFRWVWVFLKLRLLSRSSLSSHILLGLFVLLFLLWLPTIRFPIVSDTAIYALLGESLWEDGSYKLLGESYAKQLPLHSFLSYPLTHLFGMHIGMQASSLLAGGAVLMMSFLLFSWITGPTIGLLVSLFILFHHGFLYIAQVGSADLLFTVLVLASVYGYIRAEEDDRWYALSGIALGLACLTRYNGIPLFFLFGAWIIHARRDHLFSHWFFGGMGGGALLFSLWLLRNFLIFGDPLYSEYSGELMKQAPSLVEQFLSNVFYYGNPLQNLLPILLVFAAYGLVRFWRTYLFLVFVMLSLWVLTAIWWVQAMRFAFPGYVFLLFFAVLGMKDVYDRVRWKKIYAMSLTVLLVLTHGTAICLYTYGACNSFVDRLIPQIPRDLGLSSEGFYTWALARDYVDASAEQEAYVLVEGEANVRVWAKNVFRKDLRITSVKDGEHCPLYEITREPEQSTVQEAAHKPASAAEIVYQTEAGPITSVVRWRCPL